MLAHYTILGWFSTTVSWSKSKKRQLQTLVIIWKSHFGPSFFVSFFGPSFFVSFFVSFLCRFLWSSQFHEWDFPFARLSCSDWLWVIGVLFCVIFCVVFCIVFVSFFVSFCVSFFCVLFVSKWLFQMITKVWSWRFRTDQLTVVKNQPTLYIKWVLKSLLKYLVNYLSTGIESA